MKDFPAAHSMDTVWYAIDCDGNVGCFHSGEAGAVPGDACRSIDEFEDLMDAVPRQEVLDELHAAVVEGIAPLHDGAWARATTEVCLGILASSQARGPVPMRCQVATATATR